MKVSRKSWHFRMYSFLLSAWTEGYTVFRGRRNKHVPRDLCHYFWSIVAMLLTSPIWLVIALVAGTVFCLAVIVYAFYRYVLTPIGHAFMRWIDRMDEKGAERRRNRPPKEPKEPGIVRQYVAARKSKLCPMIEVVE